MMSLWNFYITKIILMSGHDMTKKPCRSGNISVIDSEYVPLKIKGSKFPDIKGFIKKFLKK